MNMDPDKERSEKKKLQHKYKQEMKGAVRELRKDNFFIEAEKSKKRKREEEKKEEKRKEILTQLQKQQADVNSLEKKRKKPVVGKKNSSNF